jgi:hypothetical protein
MMNQFEKKLRKAGTWIEAGYVSDDNVKVLHHLKPSQMARVVTECPHCERISVFWLTNYKHGRSKCSYGCFKGRAKKEGVKKKRLKAWKP